MSIVLNMVGGGGGSLKNTNAVLLVTVPTGSAVTATKGAITLTPTIWTTNADNTLDCALFYIKASQFDASAWTVTATLGADTASDTIVIDSAEEYEMTLQYDYVLYRNGTEYVQINLNPSGGATETKYATYIETVCNSGSAAARIYTDSAISLAPYSTLSCTVNIVSYSGSPVIAISIRTSPSSSATSSANFTNATGEQTATLDVSGQTGSFYQMFTTSSGVATVRFLDMRLIR